jgi:hypothetical protein
MEKSRVASFVVCVLLFFAVLSLHTLPLQRTALLRRHGDFPSFFPLISGQKHTSVSIFHMSGDGRDSFPGAQDIRHGHGPGNFSAPVTVLAKPPPVERSTAAVSLSFVQGGTRKILGKGWNLLRFSSNKLEYVDGQGWLHVRYRAGSFGGSGGLVFDSQPFRGGFNTMTVSYSLWVPPGFIWNKGGKLPGLFGGNSKSVFLR